MWSQRRHQSACGCQFDGLVLSPGPGIPDEAGQLMRIIPIAAAHSVPTLGCVWECRPSPSILVGRCATSIKSCTASVAPHGIDGGRRIGRIAAPVQIGHYHSWVVDDAELPANLRSRLAMPGLPMVRHRTLPLEAVQFHPESVLTPDGKTMLSNWLRGVAEHRKVQPVDRSAIPIWLEEKAPAPSSTEA